MLASVVLAVSFAHIAYECTLAVTVGDTWRAPWFLIGTSLAPVVLALEVPLGRTWIDRHVVLLSIAGGIARLCHVLDVFIVAFTVTPFLFYTVRVTRRAGLVLYECNTLSFAISRMTYYAIIRASAVAFVPLGLPRRIARLAIAFIGLVETLFMSRHASWRKWYKLSQRGFLRYSAVKMAVLLTLPWLEDVILDYGF